MARSFCRMAEYRSWRFAFRTAPNIYSLLDDTHVHVIDEIAFREPLKNLIAKHYLSMFFTNNYFCAYCSPLFLSPFRAQLRQVNFF
jgi:hypothetical protein